MKKKYKLVRACYAYAGMEIDPTGLISRFALKVITKFITKNGVYAHIQKSALTNEVSGACNRFTVFEEYENEFYAIHVDSKIIL